MFRISAVLGLVFLAQAVPQTCDIPEEMNAALTAQAPAAGKSTADAAEPNQPARPLPGVAQPDPNRPLDSASGTNSGNLGPGGIGSIAGQVVERGPDGARIPIAGATVELRRDREILRTETTDADGRYEMRDVEAGAYGMLASAEHFISRAARVVVVADETTERNFLLLRDVGAILGIVVGETADGQEVPIANALVQLRRGEEVLREEHTDTDGRYAMREVRPGEYGMAATADGYGRALERVAVLPGRITRQGFRLPLPREFGGVAGTVLGDSNTGQSPIAGAHVRLIHNGRVLDRTATDDAGHYEFRHVPAGQHGVLADARGYLPQAARIAVVADEVTRQDFLLLPRPPGGAITGTVSGLNADGSETLLAGALVQLHRNGNILRTTRTDDVGHYDLPNVPAGEYAVSARAEGYLPARAVVVVTADAPTEQDFVLNPQ